MTSTTRFLTVIVAVSVVGLMGVEAHAQAPDEYVTVATGGQEVPPVLTGARSLAAFRFTTLDDRLIGVRINMSHDQVVDAVHIHEAPVGVDGPIVLNMRPTGPGEGFCIDLLGGAITVYSLTSAALRGSLAGLTLTDLKNLMATGGTYINLHTPAEPSGWIRGQMIPRGSPP